MTVIGASLVTVFLAAAVMPASALTAAPDAAAAAATVVVRDFSFTDSSTRGPVTVVSAGSSVVWVFTQGVHSATEGVSVLGVSSPAAWDSGILTPADDPNTYERVFDTPGAFAYYCKVHDLNMRGTVIVV